MQWAAKYNTPAYCESKKETVVEVEDAKRSFFGWKIIPFNVDWNELPLIPKPNCPDLELRKPVATPLFLISPKSFPFRFITLISCCDAQAIIGAWSCIWKKDFGPGTVSILRTGLEYCRTSHSKISPFLKQLINSVESESENFALKTLLVVKGVEKYPVSLDKNVLIIANI